MAPPSRRAVGAKNAPRDRRHWAHGRAKCLLRAAAQRRIHSAQFALLIAPYAGFFQADEECETSYKDRGGKYQGQTGVTLPKT